MKREILLPDNFKYQAALGLTLILRARFYEPEGYHIMFWYSLETHRRKPHKKLYAELENDGWVWTGTRWLNA